MSELNNGNKSLSDFQDQELNEIIIKNFNKKIIFF